MTGKNICDSNGFGSFVRMIMMVPQCPGLKFLLYIIYTVLFSAPIQSMGGIDIHSQDQIDL